MAYHKQTLGYSTQSYQLYLSNRDIENQTNEDMPSSAPDFEVIISPEIQVSNLIFLKSTDAEACLNELTIDNLCLTFCRTEEIECRIKMNTKQHTLNLVANNPKIERSCNVPMKIQMSDFCATSNENGISYLNSILKQNVNHLIVHKYLMNFLDCNIFSAGFLNGIFADGERRNISITRPEYKLIRRYVDVALWVRKLLNTILLSHMKGNKPTTNIECIIYKNMQLYFEECAALFGRICNFI